MRDDQTSLGRKVALARARRGLSQAQLGALINRSEAWVSQVERDKRRIDRMSVLATLSEALDIPLNELAPAEPVVAAGAPVQTASRLALTLASSTALKGTLSGGGPRMSTEAAARTAEQAWDYAHSSAHEKLVALLDEFLPQLELAVREPEHEDLPSLYSALARTYHAAAAVLAKMGETAAAWVAVDRAIAVAERAEDALLMAEGAFRLTLVFQGARWFELAETTAQTALDALGSMDKPAHSALSLTGALTLQLAVVKARTDRAEDAYAHLDRAKAIAASLGTDRNDHNTEFGPTNVLLHEVAIAVELGDAGRALRAGEAVDTSALSRERQGRLLIDLARAHAQRRSLDGSVEALANAYECSPEQVRSHPVARAVLDDLIAQGHGRDERLATLREQLRATPKG